MTSRATLHALIDTLPDTALPEAESRLRALDPAPNGTGQGTPGDRGQNDTSQRAPAQELTADERRWLEDAASEGSSLAWAILHAEPLWPESNSERPHDLSRSNDWFLDAVED